MLYRTLLLLSLCVVAGCSFPKSASQLYTDSFMAHPTAFTVPADSASLMWERARRFIITRTTIATENDSLLQTTPPKKFEAPGITVMRSDLGDSVRFETFRMNRDVSGESAIKAELGGRVRQSDAREIAYYMRTGRTREHFATQ